MQNQNWIPGTGNATNGSEHHMKSVKHGKIRKTIMALGLSAAMAFGAFFSPNNALARKYSCGTRERPAAKVKTSRRGTGAYFYSYVNLGEKFRQVRIARSLLNKNMKKSDDELGMLIGANLDRAASVDGGRANASGWMRFACATLKEAKETQPDVRRVPDSSEPEEKPETGKKPSGSLTGTDEGRRVPDNAPEAPKPEPKPEYKIVGKWIIIKKFLKADPLNGGKRYSPGSALTMMRDNRGLVMAAFTRVLKREPDLAGKAIVQIITDRNGVPKKFKFKGKVNAELAQKYANIFGRTRWTKQEQTIEFPVIQRLGN